MALNHVSSNLISGLIETLEADELFHLGEVLQLLRFAQLSAGDLMLTKAGKPFANLETDDRTKALFAEYLVTYVPLQI